MIGIQILDLSPVETLIRDLSNDEASNINGGALPSCAVKSLRNLYQAISSGDPKAVWEANAKLLECFEPFLQGEIIV